MGDEKDVKEAPKLPAKETKPEAAPAGAPGGASIFRKIAVAWSIVCAAAFAATVYVFPHSTNFLWYVASSIKVGDSNVPVRPWLGVAVAVGAAILWVLMVKLKPRWEYLKPGQGTAVRMTAYVAVVAIAFFGAYQLVRLPTLRSEWWIELFSLTLAGKTLNVRLIWFPAIALFTTLVIGFHVFIDRPKWTDFLIETQSELRKVSWPPTREWVGSSTVVVIVTALVAFFLHYVDLILSTVLQKWGIGF